MRCEVCGRKIHGAPIHAVIEGAKLMVCAECAKHGKIIAEEETELGQRQPKKLLAPASFTQKKKPAQAKVEITQEVVNDYPAKIRQAREKLGLTHEELGKRINEKASVLSKIETGKMEPDNVLAAKLEHALKIKLLVPVKDEAAPTMLRLPSRETTLGDLIELNKKNAEEPTERKQS
ncbi:MAG: multiprotein bridging factor aMBF1 [Candidatus Bathyarchaeales archaeon]